MTRDWWKTKVSPAGSNLSGKGGVCDFERARHAGQAEIFDRPAAGETYRRVLPGRPPPPMENASVARKGVVAKKCAIRASILRSWSAERARKWRGASSTMGRVQLHPRCFRMSGKERTYRALNL